MDNIFDWNWKITDEQKIIEGLHCTKATSDFLGSNFEVWFANDIPMSSGPEFYHGLPGLITQASNSVFEYKITSIEYPENLPEIERPVLKSDKSVSFLEAQNNLLNPAGSSSLKWFPIDEATTIESSIMTRIKKN